MTDALTLLKEDHHEVEERFQRFEHLVDQGLSEGKEDLVGEIVRALSIHASIEERLFYPAVKSSVTDGDPLAEHLRHEHQEVKELLAELEGMDAASPQYDGKVRAVIASVRAHVREEEGDVFPKVSEALSPLTLEGMGEAMEKAKKTAPTHPHPKAPSTPPANVVAGPPTAALDRVRDAPPAKRYALLALAAAVLGLIAWRTVKRSGSD
jgi:hemerythrin superfamily protein